MRQLELFSFAEDPQPVHTQQEENSGLTTVNQAGDEITGQAPFTEDEEMIAPVRIPKLYGMQDSKENTGSPAGQEQPVTPATAASTDSSAFSATENDQAVISTAINTAAPQPPVDEQAANDVVFSDNKITVKIKRKPAAAEIAPAQTTDTASPEETPVESAAVQEPVIQAADTTVVAPQENEIPQSEEATVQLEEPVTTPEEAAPVQDTPVIQAAEQEPAAWPATGEKAVEQETIAYTPEPSVITAEETGEATEQLNIADSETTAVSSTEEAEETTVAGFAATALQEDEEPETGIADTGSPVFDHVATEPKIPRQPRTSKRSATPAGTGRSAVIKTIEPISQAKKRGRKSFKEIDAEVDLVNVPDDDELYEKQYYPISTVAGWFNVNTSLLRYWENEFDILRPRKNRKGDRLFRPEDVKNLQVIYYLLRQRKFTIEGAKEYLKANRKKADTQSQLVQSLTKFRSFLLELKAHL